MSTLHTDIDSKGICTLTLNRPDQHNAFDGELIAALISHLKNINENPDIKLMLLKANGKSFSAGADLNWMQRVVEFSEQENFDDAMQLAELMHLLNTLSKPTIAVVHGPVYGGGVGLVACCDMAVATDNAQFCLSEVKLGLIPAVISPYVISAIGERAARRYFLTAESFSAIEAYRLGLISEVCTADDLEDSISHLAENVLNNSPEAVREAKRLIQITARATVNKPLMEQTAKMIAELRVSEQAQERLQKFLNNSK